MESIRFDNGFQQYSFNGSKPVSICVTDFNMIARLMDAQEKISGIAERYRGTQATPERLAEADKEIRKIVDDAFAAPVCQAAFSTANCMSVNRSGKLLVQAFLEAFGPVIRAQIEKNTQGLRPEAAKYLK